MKKFITVSPLQMKGGLRTGIYRAVDNSRLAYDREIAFPILTAINGYTEANEEIEVVYFQINVSSAIENTNEFKKELELLCREKQLKYNLCIIEIADNNVLETHLDTFHKMIELSEDGDELYACVTFGFKPLSIVEIMALNYACKMKKRTTVNCVVYGQMNFESKEMEVYDVTSLYLLDGVIQHLAQANVKDPMKHMEMLLGIEK